MKPRPLTWMQQQFVNDLRDGKWHKASPVINGSALRGLISRGLIERRNPNEHPWSWVREGEFRLIGDATLAARGEKEGE